VLSCVGSGLWDRLITRPKESYQVPNKIKKPLVCKAAKVLPRTVESRLACLPFDLGFAGSNPDEGDEFLRAIKSAARLPS
jgi:hypothetical protein